MKLRTVIDELQCSSFKAVREELLGADVLLTPEYDVSTALNMKYVRLCKLQDYLEGLVIVEPSQILLVYTGNSIPEDIALAGNVVAISHSLNYDNLRISFVDLPSRGAVLALKKDMIFSTFLTSYDLNQFAEKISEIIGNPVIISNADQRLLAWGGEFPEDNIHIQETLKEGYVPESVSLEMEQDGVLSNARHARHSLISFNSRTDNQWVAGIIYFHYLEMGRLDVLEYQNPITGFDLELIDLSSQLAGVMIDRLGTAGEKVGFGSSALDDLISGSFVNEKTMHSQLMLTNLTLDVSYVMVVIEGILGADRDYFIRVGNLVSQAIRNSLWCVHEHKLCVLIPIGKNQSVGYDDYERTIKQFESNSAFVSMLINNDLRAFVSEPFVDLSLAPSRFKQCCALIDTDEELQRSKDTLDAAFAPQDKQSLRASNSDNLYAQNNIVYFWRHRFVTLASAMSSFDQVEMMLDKRVVAMAAYDKQHATSYLETAIMSVRYPGSPADAAAALNVHRNTYFYRTNKMRELFYLDLRDGDDRLAVAFSAKIMEGMGEISFNNLDESRRNQE